MIVHVGDSRVYQIDSALNQLTTDQTFVAREVSKGNMTIEQAKVDKRRNLLLQCVGASKVVEPQVLLGTTKKGAYMLCSDGFRHEIRRTEERTCEQSGKKDLAPVELCGLHGFRELQRFHTVLITFCKRCCKYTGFIPLKQRGKSYVI